MWNCYGGKRHKAWRYPHPKHDTIKEPFAGAAGYSQKHFKKQVYLYDLDENVITAWHYLQRASKADILGLPRLKQGDKVRELGLSHEETVFLGYLCAANNEVSRNIVSGYGGERFERTLKRIANSVYKIKHWVITLGSYEDIPNENATWFIDPPYQVGGYVYRKSSVDYNSLAKWCKSRQGQVMVCEHTTATWLDFKPMYKLQGQSYKARTEGVWSNEPTIYDIQQTRMF